MSKIRALDFANYVEQNRQRLIQHCRENGVNASDADSLDTVVNKNNQIEGQTVYHKVEFRDIDGSLLDSKIVEHNQSCEYTTIIPNLDPEYLEFDEWQDDAQEDNLSKIEYDTYVMPLYKTKQDPTINNERPTIIKILIDNPSNLSLPLYFYNYNTTNFVNAYIDWGDGSSPTQITSSTMTHTYSSIGEYVIKVYGDKYTIGGSSSYGLTNNNTYNRYFKRVYMGENNSGIISNMLRSAYNLEIITMSSTTHILSYAGTFIFGNGFNPLRALVFPNDTILNSITVASSFIETNNLQYILFNKNLISIDLSLGQNVFLLMNGCATMTKLAFPKLCTNIKCQLFGTGNAIKYLYVSNNLTTFAINPYNSNCRLVNLDFLLNITQFDAAVTSLRTNYVTTMVFNNTVQRLPNTIGGNMLTVLELPPNLISLPSTISPGDLTKLTLPALPTNLGTTVINIQYTSQSNASLGYTNQLQELILGDNWNNSLDLRYCHLLTKHNIINIANKLKNNIGSSINTITFYKTTYQYLLESTYLNAQGEEVSIGTEGAVTLLQFMQNKNWTVTLTTG